MSVFHDMKRPKGGICMIVGETRDMTSDVSIQGFEEPLNIRVESPPYAQILRSEILDSQLRLSAFIEKVRLCNARATKVQ